MENLSTKRVKWKDHRYVDTTKNPEIPIEQRQVVPCTTATATGTRLMFFREADVGIDGYVHPETPGFRGLVKERYSDFSVHELDLEGNVVHLTSLQALDNFNETEKKESSFGMPTSSESPESCSMEKHSSRTYDWNSLKQWVVHEEDIERILEYYRQPKEERPKELLILVS
jgi:hypothetical protein